MKRECWLIKRGCYNINYNILFILIYVILNVLRRNWYNVNSNNKKLVCGLIFVFYFGYYF